MDIASSDTPYRIYFSDKQRQIAPDTMIRRKILEDIGIDIPDDANRFFTRNSTIVFLVLFVDEHGNSIVFREEQIEAELTERQIELLKAENCYGDTGWSIV
jgi:hypothetical protein